MKLTQMAMASLGLAFMPCLTLAQDIQSPDKKESDSGAYGALGITAYDSENYGADFKLGYNLNKNFGVEAQGTLGLSSHSVPVCSDSDCATLTEKTDYTIGAFAVGRIPLSDQFEIFARAGVHETKYNIRISNPLLTNFDQVRTGFAGGGGVQYKLDSKNAIRAEYTYLDKVDANTGSNMATISYVRKF